jgi:hypothetical protein
LIIVKGQTCSISAMLIIIKRRVSSISATSILIYCSLDV